MSPKNSDTDVPEGFLNRWALRKHQASNEVNLSPVSYAIDSQEQTTHTLTELAPDILVDLTTEENGVPQTIRQTTGSPAALGNSDSTEPVILCDEDMPAIQSLTAKSDLSDFFNAGVSASLRRAALRHIFSLPIYNVRDGLNDYDDDYTSFEPLGDTITSDMKWHEARKQRALDEEKAAIEAERLAKTESEEAAQTENNRSDTESTDDDQQIREEHEHEQNQEQEQEQEAYADSSPSPNDRDNINYSDNDPATTDCTSESHQRFNKDFDEAPKAQDFT